MLDFKAAAARNISKSLTGDSGRSGFIHPPFALTYSFFVIITQLALTRPGQDK